MADFLKFLNANAGVLNLLFTAVVAIATAVYAVLTARLVRETRDLRRAQTEPRIEIFARMRDEWVSLIDLVIKNIGLGPAYDIRFQISTERETEGSAELIRVLTELRSVTSGISFLAPGQEFSSHWTVMTDRFETKIEARITFKSTYRDASGMSYEREYAVDFSEFKGVRRVGEPPLIKIARLMEDLKRDTSSLVTGLRRLNVDIYDSDDRKAERAAWEEERAKRLTQAKPE
jgi:hypothetical protein